MRPGLLHLENVVIEDVAQGRVLPEHHGDGHLQEPQSRGSDDLALSAKQRDTTYFKIIHSVSAIRDGL